MKTVSIEPQLSFIAYFISVIECNVKFYDLIIISSNKIEFFLQMSRNSLQFCNG